MKINLANAKAFEGELSAALGRGDNAQCARLLAELLLTPMQANMPIHREFKLLLARHPLTRIDILYPLFSSQNLDLSHPLLLNLCECYYAEGLALARQTVLSEQNRSSAVFCQVPAKSIHHVPNILAYWSSDPDPEDQKGTFQELGACCFSFDCIQIPLHTEHQKDIFFLRSPRFLPLTLSPAIAQQWMRDCIARFPESRLDQSNHGVSSEDPRSFFERLEGDVRAWALDHLVYALTGGLGVLPEIVHSMMKEARTICTVKRDLMVSRFNFARLWGDVRGEMRRAVEINFANAEAFEGELSEALGRGDNAKCVSLLAELLLTSMQENVPIYQELKLILARHPLARIDILYPLFLSEYLDLSHPLLLDLCERYYAECLALARQTILSRKNRSSAIFCHVHAHGIQHISEILSSWFPCDTDQAFSLFYDKNPLQVLGASFLSCEYMQTPLWGEHQKDVFFLWSPRLLRLTSSPAIAQQWMRDCIARFPASHHDQSCNGVSSEDPGRFFDRLEGDVLAWALDHLLYALTGGLGFPPETVHAMVKEAHTICTAKCDPMVSRFNFARLWGDAREEMRIVRGVLEKKSDASNCITKPKWLGAQRFFSEPFGVPYYKTFKMLKPIEIYFPWNEASARLWCCRCVELNHHDFVRWGFENEMCQAVELARAVALADTDGILAVAEQTMENLYRDLSRKAQEYRNAYNEISGKLTRKQYADDSERAVLEAQLDEQEIKKLLLESLSFLTNKRPQSEYILEKLWVAERIELYKERYQDCKDDYDPSKTLDCDDLEDIDDSACELLMYDCDARCRAYFNELLDLLTSIDPIQTLHLETIE